MQRKISLSIEGIGSFEGVWTPVEGVIPTPEPPIVVPEPPIVEPPIQSNIDWAKLSNEGGEIESGFTYLVPEYLTSSAQNVRITKKGNNPTEIIFGKKGYSKWEGTQPRFLFNSGSNPCQIEIDGIDLFCNGVADEVEPFVLTFFTGSGLNQKATLRNLRTNLERALAYSASQEVTQLMTAENVNFEGYIWEELKANKGGGLKGIMKNCNLKQIDPKVYFESSFNFERNQVSSLVKFQAIENQFHAQGGNACNILYVDGMTFFLPNGKEVLGNVHPIRPIPNVGDLIYLTQGPEFLQTKNNSLQAGDQLEINGTIHTIISKDRPNQGFMDGYPIDLNIGVKIGPVGSEVKATVVKSNGLKLIGKNTKGYMIFKDNNPRIPRNTAHFQTSINGNQPLDYYLESNPLGVLSYNHEEITFDYEKVIHNGYYRQSLSRVGHSNGYRFVKCEGYGDQFNPPVPVITE